MGFRRGRRGGTARAGGRAAVRSTGVKRCASSELTGVHTIKHLKRGAWRFPAFCILCAYVVVRSKYLLRVPPFFRPSFKLEIGRRNPRGATESSRPRPPQAAREDEEYVFFLRLVSAAAAVREEESKKGHDTCQPHSHFECQHAASSAAYHRQGLREGRRDGRRGRSAKRTVGPGKHSEFLRHISLDAEVRTRH